MKQVLFCVLLAVAVNGVNAGPVPPINVVLVAAVYQTKRTMAEPFLRGDRLDAGQFAHALAQQAQGFNSTTKITRLPAITTRSGQRSVSPSGDTYFETQAVIAPDGETVDVNAVFKLGEKRLTTSGFTKFGGTLFVGSVDSAGEFGQFVFIRVLKHL